MEPYISEETLEFHHEKHHQSYINNLNQLIEGTKQKDLMHLIRHSHNKLNQMAIFNNAAQIWNHTFYWHSMCASKNTQTAPKGKIESMITRDFGGYQQFQNLFMHAGKTLFGSGYVWLVLNKEGTLEIRKTGNAELPLDAATLLTCDVWEHAYYIDHRNRRPDYLTYFVNHLINWDFASENLRHA